MKFNPHGRGIWIGGVIMFVFWLAVYHLYKAVT